MSDRRRDPQVLADPQALAEALLTLEGTVRANGVAMRHGLGELRRQMEALGAQVTGHLEHCQGCREELQAEILANEREARKREQAATLGSRTELVEALDKLGARVAVRLDDHESRLRWVERWVLKGAGVAAVIGAAAAVAGRLMLEKVWR